MIERFRHKGLQLLFEKGDRSKLNPQYVARISLILSTLDAAKDAKDMDQPAFHLHELKGSLRGYWAITVRANWRIIFRFNDGHACDVDLVDYH
ncbi:MAG: type II toxin-antitoxin system RelE/ParE family toxin [Alphaproteobacteria bacterium]|nr:type II toxin-antitoxin system RelE/ParE family toxin [Alphaproteobacteria bacterium]